MPPNSIGFDSSGNLRADEARSGISSVLPERARRNFSRWLIVAVSTASLAACAQAPIARKTAFLAPDRQMTAEHNRSPLFLPVSRAPGLGPLQSGGTAVGTQVRSNGIASFYTEGQQTANGERFDPCAMTAAHRTLPFGTRLRVTNIATGRSVTVRVNDRGPYIKGRVVDVSYSAAMALGMVRSGIASVKLDVVRLASPRKPRHELNVRRVSELVERRDFIALITAVDQ
jgi:rare lipoprotein A